MRLYPVTLESLEARSLLASVPAGFSDSTVLTGLSQPTALQVLPDGRWLVTEKGGRLRVIKNSAIVSTAVTIPTENVGERGLLGVTADPNFASNKRIYLYYTPQGTTKGNRVVRYTLGDNNLVSSGPTTILQLENLTGATNHNGGAMHFGPDGKLYVASGENAQPSNAQTLSNRLGKILRLNTDGSIPTDNPFYNTASGVNRAIYVYGLRNAFTFAFHPTSGRMHINDVGQNTWEEVNLGRPGGNYGWPATEGATSDSRFITPLYSYNHNNAAAAIAGGAFYAGIASGAQQFPSSYASDYFFGDFSTGVVRVMDAGTNAVSGFGTGFGRVVDLDVMADGSLVYMNYDGKIGRVRYTPQVTKPVISRAPQSVTRATGQTATFTVEASGSAPLKYQWLRNNAAIAGATAASYTTGALSGADNGALYSVVVSNSAGSTTSGAAKLTVTSNTAPTPTINAPAAATTFYGGQTITYGGSATDAQDGTLPASKLSWTIEYITGGVVRPFDTRTGVAGGSFVVPTVTPYTKTDVNFRITLTATDSAGATASVVRQLQPQISTIKFAANVSGVSILLDGQPQPTPSTITSLRGLQRTIEAPASVVVNGATYAFNAWSDGGLRSRTASIPAGTLDLTAYYVPAGRGTGQISGYVVNDVNADGQWSGGESGIANRTVWIDTDNDAVIDTGEPVQITAANGKYVFANLAAGSHVVRQLIPSGWRQTRPAPGSGFTVSLAAGQTIAGRDFATTGSSPTPSPTPTPTPTPGSATLSGYVVNDTNKDGRWSSGESGLASRRVFLDADNDGNYDAGEITQLTASNGKYVFSNLAAGTYSVRQVLPSGWRQTNPAPGTALVTKLTTGQTLGGRDFGTTLI